MNSKITSHIEMTTSHESGANAASSALAYEAPAIESVLHPTNSNAKFSTRDSSR